MKKFEDSSYLAQVRRLRKLAEEAVKKFPVKVKTIYFIHHGENATFKVTDNKNQKYLLRIHRGGYHTVGAIREELAWVENVGCMTDLKVPVPLRSKENNLVENIFLSEINRERQCCMFHWIEGERMWKGLSEKHLYLIGQNMGKLQKHTGKRKVKHRNYWTADGLLGKNPKMGPVTNLSVATKKEQEIITRKRDEVFKVIKAYEQKYPQRSGLIHADMHLGNVIFAKNEMGIIDFDDSGYGAYMYDVVIPLIMTRHALKERKDLKLMPKFKEAMLKGYSENMNIEQIDMDMIDWYEKARAITMLGWVQSRSDNPRINAFFKRNVKRTAKYLQEN